MVFTNKYSESLIIKFPNFALSKSLAEAYEWYEVNGELNACALFTGLTHYVAYELIKNNKNITQEERDIYLFIENVREKFHNYEDPSPEFNFDNAICTCFLENLLNIASHNSISYARFIPYLGEKSKEYCRAWDEFTGVKSPGLW